MQLNAGIRRETATFLGAVLALLCFLATGVRAQDVQPAKVVAAEYFVGADPGEGAGASLSPEDGTFDSDVEGNLELNLDVGGLAAGEHRVGIRYQDDAGFWSSVRWLDLVVSGQTPSAGAASGGSGVLSRLVAAEYFVGTDPGEGAGTALSSEDGAFDSDVEGNLELDLDVGGLAAGEHRVGIRYKDDAGAWSAVRWIDLVVSGQSMPEETASAGLSSISRVVAAEYFFDNDPGEGAGTPLNPEDGAFDSDVEGNLEVNLDVGGLAAGGHRVGIRYKDEAGVWSAVSWLDLMVSGQSMSAEAASAGLSSLSRVVAAEYFVGTDPGEGAGTQISAEDGTFDSDVEGNLQVDLDMSGLAPGEHLVGIRYKDDAGAWSPVSWLDLVVNAPAGATSGGLGSLSQVVAAEYFVDNDPGAGAGTALNPEDGTFDSDVEGNLELNLDMSGLAAGEHRVGIRYKDEAEAWSPVSWLDLVVSGENLTPESTRTGSVFLSRLVTAEYFVDNDPGEGAGTPMNPEDGAFDSDVEGNLEVNLDVSGFAAGEHKVGIRYKDDAGVWSPVRWLNFLVVDEPVNFPPTDIHLSGATVAENQATGTYVGQFTATDPDANATHSFTLVAGTGSTHNSLFTIDANGNLKTAAILDHEANATLSIRVQAKDDQDATLEKVFSISVTDIAENIGPVITSYDGNATVEMNVAEGVTYAAEVNATDADGDALTYSIHDGADVSKFDLNPNTGVLTFKVPPGFENPSDADVNNTYEVTIAVSDGTISAMQSFTLTVVDATAPVITLIGVVNVTHEAGVAYVDSGATWTDTSDGNGTVVATGAVNPNLPGVYVLTYDFADAAGNVAATVTRTVTVVDTTAPVITLIGDANITHEVGVAYVDMEATWTDTLDGNGTLAANGAVNVNAPGVYVLTYDFTDAAGNAAFTVTRTVTVEDTTAPVITLIGDANIRHEEGVAYVDLGAIWTDTFDANGTLAANGAVNVNAPGVYVLTYDFTDAAGNEALTVTRTVTVVDATAPIITLIGAANIPHEEGVAYVDLGAIWTDTFDANGTLAANGAVNVNAPGVYVLTYDFTDVAGNAAYTVKRTVTVVDATAPVITLIGDVNVTHEAGVAYVDLGAIWTDTFDGNGTLATNGAVNVNALGVYVLTYDFTDASGNAALTVRRTVTVADTTVPVITLIGNLNITHEAGLAYVDLGATWTDTFDGNGTLATNGAVNVNALGVYVLTYDFTDASGNAAFTVKRTVTVADTTASVITLNGVLNVTHEAGLAYVDLGATWMDSFDGNGTLAANGAVNVNALGVYVLTYDFTDAAGNAALTVRRTVTVTDAPNIFIDVTLSGTKVTEQRPAGGIVGQFHATDFAQGATHAFALVEGNGSQHNHLFTIDANGMLKTAAILDYEVNATLNIRVRGTAARNVSLDKAFSISVIDVEEKPANASWHKELDRVALGGGWYSSNWLGTFWDGGSGWIYHWEHGWLYPLDDGAGNYWLYHANLGWLWTGSSLYGQADGRRFLYSISLYSWLYFDKQAKNFYVYEDSRRIDHRGDRIARLKVSSSADEMGLVSGGGYHKVGATVNLMAVPEEGYQFVEWRSSKRGVLGTGTSLQLEVTEAEEISGSFVKKTDEEILKGVFD